MDEWQRSRMTAGMGVPKQSSSGSKRDRRMIDPFLPRTRWPCVTFTPLKIRRPWVPGILKSFPERVGKSTGRTEIHMFGTRFPACFPLESIHSHMPLELRGLLKWNYTTKKHTFLLLRVTHQWSIWRKFYDFYIFGDYPMVWSHQSFFGTYYIYCHKIII